MKQEIHEMEYKYLTVLNEIEDDITRRISEITKISVDLNKMLDLKDICLIAKYKPRNAWYRVCLINSRYPYPIFRLRKSTGWLFIKSLFFYRNYLSEKKRMIMLWIIHVMRLRPQKDSWWAKDGFRYYNRVRCLKKIMQCILSKWWKSGFVVRTASYDFTTCMENFWIQSKPSQTTCHMTLKYRRVVIGFILSYIKPYTWLKTQNKSRNISDCSEGSQATYVVHPLMIFWWS